MNDATPPGRSPDGIEAGKRLIRVGGDRGLSLAERISERFQRLTWRTPIHQMRLKGRHPLKLIAVADDPFMGDVKRGNALLDGMLSYLGETRNIPGLALDKPSFSPRFADYLHSFAWLRDLSSVATRATAAPIAEAVMRQWLEVHAESITDPAWRADLWGRRILFWVSHAPLILSSTDLVYRSRVLHVLARGARHLDRAADRAAPGPARIAAWCGVLAAGLVIPGGDPRRSFGEAGLARALSVSVFDDGGVVDRSPASQLDAIMLLTMLREVYAARRLDAPESVRQTLERMVAALLGVCHGDGTSSWQGAGPIAGDRLAPVIEATAVRVRALRQAREWGYQRMAAGRSVVILDGAPPPVSRLTTGGCASTLAFEFSDDDQRIVVNCGGGQSAHIAVPQSLSDALRTTAAHSTLVIADSNSTALNADGSLGRGVVEVELSRQDGNNSTRIEASHDGYARRNGFVHRRALVMASDGRDLRGEDMLLPTGRKRKKDTPFVIRFHLAPGIEIAPTADGMAAFLSLPNGQTVWQFRARGAVLSVEDSVWIDWNGRPVATQQLVLSGESPPGGANVSWAFSRTR